MRNPAVRITLTVALLFATTLIGTAQAQSGPISLAPIGDDSSPHIVKTLNIYGSCGGAVVQVIGIDQDKYVPGNDSFSFDISAANVGVFVLADTGKQPAKLDVSDHNTVLCVQTGKAFRLVVGSTCGGSSCNDAMNYAVVEPKLGKTISPGACDIACASKILKSNALKKMGLL